LSRAALDGPDNPTHSPQNGCDPVKTGQIRCP
jgi:hypothetical protein